MPTTRRMRIGEKTIIIQNVPEYITDEQLHKFALQKMIELGIENYGKAS